MKITFIIILLATALATAIARQDPPLLPTKSSSTSYINFGEELRGLLAKAGGMWGFSASVNETMHHSSKHKPSHKARRSVHGGGKATAKKGNPVNCISASVCEKKKMICTKLCSKASVNTEHLTNKCYIKCSKCKPTC